ncbi:MAG TPA: IPT/TIG domain-containing protein [Puia sp.]|nr:IPT/TIG domain-containing protein [Puia sp.]
MLRLPKHFSYLSAAMLVLALIQWGCMKKDVYPSRQFPQITSLSPSSAIMGTPIIIKGTNLKNVTDVKFGTVEAANFNASNNTDTAIKVTVPDSLALGPIALQVYYDNGNGYATANFTVLLVPPVPKIDSVSPKEGFPGNTVTISGNNFALVTTVTFNGVIASFAHSLDTNGKMTAIIPANATGGAQFIKLTNPNGSDSIAFTVDLGPVIATVTPGQGKAGDSITVTGQRFTGTTSVGVNAKDAGFTVWNDSTLKFAVPTGASNGNITVTTPLGTGTSPQAFVVVVPISKFIYDEALFDPNWQISSYSAPLTRTVDTTAHAESGTHCLFTSIGSGYDAFRITDYSGTNAGFIDLSPYTTLRFSVYGGPGTDGLQLNIGVNGKFGLMQITISEGKYTDYFIPLSSLGSPTTLSEFILQEYSGKTPAFYVDNIGLN